jgi:hypothetical protein
MTTEWRRAWLQLIAVALFALPGCALVESQVAADSEEILAQAGFQRHPLDEPGLPSRHLVEAAGSYKFADPDFCRCVYVGGAAEYAELQELRARRIAEREWILSRSSVQGGPADRALWSAWKPAGLDAINAPIATTDTSGDRALH